MFDERNIHNVVAIADNGPDWSFKEILNFIIYVPWQISAKILDCFFSQNLLAATAPIVYASEMCGLLLHAAELIFDDKRPEKWFIICFIWITAASKIQGKLGVTNYFL